MPAYLITGATDGIGRFTAESLGGAGHTVLVHGRNPGRIAAVVDAVNARGGEAFGYCADLSSLAEVRQLGEQVSAAHPRLDGLLHNAGTYDGDYTGKRLESVDGNEYSLAVNVLAPFLLTSLLLSNVRSSGRGRILITSSISMGAADALDDLQCNRLWTAHRAYSLSKLCDAMLAKELDARYGDAPRLCINSMDPGTVDTKMLRAGWGAWGAPVSSATTSFRMLTEPRWGQQSGEVTCSSCAEVDDALVRRRLWDACVDLTGAEYPTA